MSAVVFNGQELTIKHPYLQISNNGFVNLRVDNPSNVIRHHSNSRPLVTTPALAIANDTHAVHNNPNASSSTTIDITFPPITAVIISPIISEIPIIIKNTTTSATSANEKNGIYDYLTLPFSPDLQNEVENFYGPIEVLNAGPTKGIYAKVFFVCVHGLCPTICHDVCMS